MELTKSQIEQFLFYENGKLFWKQKNKRSPIKIGQQAGCLTKEGYRKIKICNKMYYEHRVIWMLHHNTLPEFLDHIDGNKENNKIENLRPATVQQNSFNRKKRQTSFAKNIYFDKTTNKWRVSLKMNNKTRWFGSYGFFDIAETIARLVRHKYCGEFANHG